MSHAVSLKAYFTVFLVLLALTALTVTVAFLDLGPLSTFLALTIAGIKASLVVLYFMHLRHGDRLLWVVAAAGLIWLGILIVITVSDYLSRSAILA